MSENKHYLRTGEFIQDATFWSVNGDTSSTLCVPKEYKRGDDMPHLTVPRVVQCGDHWSDYDIADNVAIDCDTGVLHTKYDLDTGSHALFQMDFTLKRDLVYADHYHKGGMVFIRKGMDANGVTIEYLPDE